MTVVGTRPELIKLSRVIHRLGSLMNHVLVHTGQNYDYELNEVFFKELGIKKPDHYLEAACDSVAKSIGNIIEKVDAVLEKEKPDAVLIYGDTNSCLSVIAAKRRQIPIFHMEAGNRCFDLRVPEEINRKIVDHLSDINMVHSEHARKYLLNEGVKPETIIKTGSPMREILNHHKSDIDQSQILEKLSLKKGEYFIVSVHREENVDNESNFKELLDALNVLAEEFKVPVIVSTHPRTRKRLDDLGDVSSHSLIQFMKPLGFLDYVHLQKNAKCVISDSGTITEESSLLSFPAITIRKTHERPEGMDVGAIIMSGLSAKRVVDSVKITLELQKDKINEISDYKNEAVSSQVIKVIQSYTDYVNRTVWSKGN
jgi:UDP-N-acetylglucosamine 2-epimerase